MINHIKSYVLSALCIGIVFCLIYVVSMFPNFAIRAFVAIVVAVLIQAFKNAIHEAMYEKGE